MAETTTPASAKLSAAKPQTQKKRVRHPKGAKPRSNGKSPSAGHTIAVTITLIIELVPLPVPTESEPPTTPKTGSFTRIPDPQISPPNVTPTTGAGAPPLAATEPAMEDTTPPPTILGQLPNVIPPEMPYKKTAEQSPAAEQHESLFAMAAKPLFAPGQTTPAADSQHKAGTIDES